MRASRALHFLASLVAMASLAWAGAARAEGGASILAPDTLSATGDVRLTGVDGEPSWLDGGYGRLRFGDHGDFRVKPRLAEGDLIWQPRFGWSLSGTVVAIAQRGQQHPIDLSEAILNFKPLLPGATKVSARLGLFWPTVSLEHGASDWRVVETITPSAINSWIGDEVKVGAAEATVSTPVAGTRLALTAAIFGFNDTSGTLLSFRGWALHDQKATAFGLQPLPPLNAFMQSAQAPRTRPVIELDDRPGWYAGLAWSPGAAVELHAFHYDNRGDPEAVTPTLQWGWRTKFDNLGAVLSLGRLTLKSQAMAGRTLMGFAMPDRLWVDTRFRSAFLLATRALPRGSISARVEAFGTRSRGSVVERADSEDGWALTGAVRREIGDHVSVIGEILHVDSDRPVRSAVGLAPRQRQTQAQLAVRLHL